MSEIEIKLSDEDIEVIKNEGALIIPLQEGIIDRDPSIALVYDGDRKVI